MSDLFTVEYWKTTAELVVRSAAIGATSAMGGSVIDAWHLDWKAIAGFALGGGALSLLTSLSAIAVGQKGSPLVTTAARDV